MAQIAARVSEEEKAELDRFCKEQDIKLSQLIRWALRDYIQRKQEER